LRLFIWIRELADVWNDFVRSIRHRVVNKVAESVLMNMDIINAVEGARSSARFEREKFLHVDTFNKRKQLYRHALSLAPEQGLLFEFGTYKGASINQLAKLMPNKRFYGFDSFAGLPEGWTAGTHQGGLNANGKLQRVRNNVRLIRGFFDASLPPFLKDCGNEQVAFVHIDCDLYSSTKTVLDLLKSRLIAGTVLVFDEYYNYPSWLQGEYKAWTEFCKENSVAYEYIGYIRMGSQAAVKITTI